MIATRTILRIVLMATLGSSLPLFARDPVSIMRTGSFHGDEIAAGSEGRWFALVFDPDGAYLRGVRATVTIEQDVVSDNDAEKTGKRVDITPALEAVALLRGIPTLKPGRIPSAFTDRAIELGHVVEARMGKRKYSFALHCVNRATIDGQDLRDCSLTVRTGTSKEELFKYSAYIQEGEMRWLSENPPAITWAGDIDGDSRLDVLLNTSDHFNEYRLTLYLSSAAKPGRLVHAVATFVSIGC